MFTDKINEWLKEKYQFTIKDTTLLRDAFTHASFLNENNEVSNDYERLEFMGDAVVEIWVSKKLFLHKPEISEGNMTTMRAQLVCEKTLASFLKKLGLQKFIRLGVGEEKSHARDRESLLADIFEAFIGAVYLDQGFEKVDLILSDTITIIDTPSQSGVIDYKSKLQELVQADSRKVLKYQLLKESGQANYPSFEIGVYLDNVLLGVGIEHSKKKAEQLAAKEALEKMVV